MPSSAGGKRKHVPFRRQRLVLDSTLPASELSAAPSVAPRDDPLVADLLRVADGRIAELEREIAVTSDRNVALEGKMATFVRQVSEQCYFSCMASSPVTAKLSA